MKVTEVPTSLLRNLFSEYYWRAMPNRQLSYWASFVSAVSLIFVGFCVTGSRCRIGVKVRLEGTLIHDGIVIPVSLCCWITSCLKIIELTWICLQINVRLLQIAAQCQITLWKVQPKFLSDWLTQSMEFIIDSMQMHEYGWIFLGCISEAYKASDITRDVPNQP